MAASRPSGGELFTRHLPDAPAVRDGRWWGQAQGGSDSDGEGAELPGRRSKGGGVVDEVDAKERGGDDDALGARCAICLVEFSRPGEAAQGVTIRLTPVC